MSEKEKSVREEYIYLIKEKITEFSNWVKPNPTDLWFVQILKTILKIPVILFMTLISPILFVILGIVFIAVI